MNIEYFGSATKWWLVLYPIFTILAQNAEYQKLKTNNQQLNITASHHFVALPLKLIDNFFKWFRKNIKQSKKLKISGFLISKEVAKQVENNEISLI